MGLLPFFGASAALLSDRIATMQFAERSLMDLARQFGRPPPDATLEMIDTPVDAVGRGGCQMRGDGPLVLHGVVCRAPAAVAAAGSGAAPLVLLHGYANGCLYFYRNLYGLARQCGTVYALDMLGWGLSSRPAFNPPGWLCGTFGSVASVEEGEAFTVESLERWRAARDIPKMILAGHSLGGYLSVAYAERYPERVERLILLSPVGVPQGDSRFEDRAVTWKQRLMYGALTSYWTRGYTPGSLMRTLPEGRGRGMVRSYVEGRLPAVRAEDERSALTEYLYTNALLPPSGEYCLNALLRPFAYAHRPTGERIAALQVPHVAFVYGTDDWMDVRGGTEVAAACGGAAQGPAVEVYQIRDAGHLLMLDNWEEFNAALVLACGGKLEKDAPEPIRVAASQ